MSKFQKLEEEIRIEITDPEEDCINIILRNTKNDNKKYSFDKNIIKYVKDLRLDV